MAREEHQAKYFTHLEIRARGGIGNLAEGAENRTHGVRTRMIAWPGNGYITESVHVLTLSPGESSDTYTYDLAEEAMLCFQGSGEALVRGQWVTMRPGDLAYFPEGVKHAVRNPAGAERDLILTTQISPPQLNLYVDGGSGSESPSNSNTHRGGRKRDMPEGRGGLDWFIRLANSQALGPDFEQGCIGDSPGMRRPRRHAASSNLCR